MTLFDVTSQLRSSISKRPLDQTSQILDLLSVTDFEIIEILYSFLRSVVQGESLYFCIVELVPVFLGHSL